MIGILQATLSIDTTLEQFKTIIDINLIGTFLMYRVCLPQLLIIKGNIVNATSIAGLHGHSYTAAYAASKRAIIVSTKSFVREYILQGVHVNAIAPGDTLTTLLTFIQFSEGINQSLFSYFQLSDNRLGQPDEIAAVVAMLAPQDGSFINGEVIRIDESVNA
ncbi:unnamed protein product [Rotaria sordida]|uniref:Uncharacterized protein n=2 Tax=Rotaria sordida TaxID=392033 RepID=A0A813NJW1_9BILA|nr:unnamed protein product [Rotaria sordida]CAF0799166.1 unnamed protein product [Rotaria sordida]CAF3562913.1 unnamed protein product [Rotaria sordida]